MIKVLKIQKGVLLIVLGVIAIITYAVMIMYKMQNSRYVLGFSGFLFILGSLMLLYPILTAKKDKDGAIELDQEKATDTVTIDEDKKAEEENAGKLP